MGREAILNSVTWSIGNEEKVQIRTNKWLKRDIVGGPKNRNDPQFVSELMNFEKGSWNEQLLNTCLMNRPQRRS